MRALTTSDRVPTCFDVVNRGKIASMRWMISGSRRTLTWFFSHAHSRVEPARDRAREPDTEGALSSAQAHRFALFLPRGTSAARIASVATFGDASAVVSQGATATRTTADRETSKARA